MWTVCAQPDSTGSSPYVLVHIVGPLAATADSPALFWLAHTQCSTAVSQEVFLILLMRQSLEVSPLRCVVFQAEVNFSEMLKTTCTGVERIYSREGPIVDFPGAARKIFEGLRKKWQDFMFIIRNEGNNLFLLNCYWKMSNFKIQGDYDPFSDAHAPVYIPLQINNSSVISSKPAEMQFTSGYS